MNWFKRLFSKTEEELDILEQEIPLLAEKACRNARTRALENGIAVVEMQGGSLVRVFPNGEIEIIKENRR